MGAVWIASREARKVERDQKKHEDGASREVAYLAYDALQFLIRSASASHDKKSQRYFVVNAEFQELLERLVWARRNVVERVDLDDLADIRNSLTEVTQHHLENGEWINTIPPEELELKKLWMEDLRNISQRRESQRHADFREAPTRKAV